MTTANYTNNEDFIQAHLVVTVETIFGAMRKPFNALVETKFAYIGYIGYIALWAVGFIAVATYKAYTKTRR